MLHSVFHVEPADAAPDLAWPEWLSEAEGAQARSLRFERRRRDWLCGRRAAKEAVARVMRERWSTTLPLAHITVESQHGGAPCVRLSREAAAASGFAPGQLLPVAVTISHRAGAVFCAAASADEVADTLGADLELLEPRSAAFVEDFFAAEEIAACAASGGAPEAMAAIVWSAKEAVLKALRLGLTVDTRTVICLPERSPTRAAAVVDGEGWRTVRLLESPPGAGPVPLTCLWRTRGPFVQTLAYGPPALRSRGAA